MEAGPHGPTGQTAKNLKMTMNGINIVTDLVLSLNLSMVGEIVIKMGREIMRSKLVHQVLKLKVKICHK